MMELNSRIYGGLLGLAVGDALGVPVEFCSRKSLDINPVKGMRERGTHGQVAGTWSDDSSLTFCLMESLKSGEINLHEIASNFLAWLSDGYWTPHGIVFDRGIATTNAIRRFGRGTKPDLCGGMDESDNGNGSLMRILPVVFIENNASIGERYSLVRKISSITHMHFRSVFSCFIYTEYARLLIEGMDKFKAYELMIQKVNQFIDENDFNPNEIRRFNRILNGKIHELSRDEISGSGYVLHTLEASLWCLLSTSSYSEATLKAVNLGEDTDTTGAVTGGIAGLFYGIENIPNDWLDQIARKDDIQKLIKEFELVIPKFDKND